MVVVVAIRVHFKTCVELVLYTLSFPVDGGVQDGLDGGVHGGSGGYAGGEGSCGEDEVLLLCRLWMDMSRDGDEWRVASA